MRSGDVKLGVNIDHVATVRQARYVSLAGRGRSEPDPVEAARIAERSGADCITAHLREDRRHVLDIDIFRLRRVVKGKFNLEMSATPDIVAQALKAEPDQATLVPENRREITTEGGLDLARASGRLDNAIQALRARGIAISLFLDPDPKGLHRARDLGVQAVELHTGAYADAPGAGGRVREIRRLRDGARLAARLGLKVYAGHGLNYRNLRAILSIPQVEEVNIGHSIVSRAVFVGMEAAVREMKEALK